GYSDIELGVFWKQPPNDEERREVVELADGDLIRLYPYDAQEEVWSDDFMMGRAASNLPQSGILVEVGHYTVDFMNRTLESVLQHYDPDELKQNLISGVVDGLPLHNQVLLRQWQQQAQSYPDQLSVAVINRHALIDHFWRCEMFLHRDQNFLLLYQTFSRVQIQILNVLSGLNHTYYFGFKWLDVVVKRLPIAPTDLLDRLRQVYQTEPAHGIQLLTTLVEETYDLVEQHMPQIDVDRLRRIFRYRRPFWEEPPPR
ncbi:MAG TPA: hypothetical protein VFN35_32000, partial [Ktedonobacteraceae bacterium]|nr:hypothetical protein [Ktedonobacteraceae bacterium]